MNISRYEQNYINESCVVINSLKEPFINFDKLRKDHFSSLRSVDFLKIKGSLVILVEITDLKGTVESIRKEIKKRDKVILKGDSHAIKELLKAEYREKFFESLFLLQFLDICRLVEKVRFLIVLCNADKQTIFRFIYLRNFIKYLLPQNWECDLLLKETFERVFV